MKNTQATLAEFARDVRVGLRDAARSDLEGFEAIMQGNGYDWLGDRVAMLLASASGSRVPIAELMKTPLRTQTVKKTRAITTAAEEISSRVVMANTKLLGSPVNKASSSSRAPLSPLGGRNLNVNSADLPIRASSPAKSQPSKASTSKSSTKSDKAKPKGTTTKKGRPKKVPDGENAAQEVETSTSSRSGASQSTQPGDLMSTKVSVKGKKGQAVSEPVRPPRSPQRAVPVEVEQITVDQPMEEAEEREELAEAAQSIQNANEQEMGEHMPDEAMPEEEEEITPIEEDSATSIPPPSLTSSAPSRPRTVDLSIIAEAEEDRSSIIIPNRSLASNNHLTAPTADSGSSATQSQLAAAIDETSPAAATDTESTPSLETPAPAPHIPARPVRSSWLNKALSAVPTTNAQRTSDGTERPAIGPINSSRLSTTDFPTMRKSLAQPGILAKRKSEVVLDAEEEVDVRRPEKVARVETASILKPDIIAQPAPTPAFSTTSTAPLASYTITKPAFERQISQEIFSRPGPASLMNQSTSVAPEALARERPSSEIDRVTKALDDMKERQQAKEVAKQKAALSSSTITAVSAPPNRPKTTTGSGFLRGIGMLGRSLGIGAAAGQVQADPNEEEKRRLEEEEERKAREELNEIMKKVDKPEVEDKQVEDEEMTEKTPETLAPILAVSVSKSKEEEDELDSDEEAEVNQSIDFDSIPMNLGERPVPTAPTEQSSLIAVTATPARLPRNQIQSTTPQGTPPRSLPILVPSRPTQQTSPAKTLTLRQVEITSVETLAAKSTVHDRINLFNNASVNHTNAPFTAHTPSAPVPRSALLFSPSRNTTKQSESIDIVEQQRPTVAPKQVAGPVEHSQVSPETDNEADNETEEEQEEDEEEEEPIEEPTSSRPASQAGNIFGQASVIANKALGVKPNVGQVKSVQLAAAAQKKDLAASERRALMKEQRLKNKAERLAEEKDLKDKKEAEEKRRKLAEMEKRKYESDQRKALIIKQKEERAERERAEAEKEKAEMEKRKLASSQNRPGALQPAKRVISASSSTLTLNTGVGKMKEPVKLTKPAGPIPPAHGPSKLVPSTFRTAPAPPETPAHQMSQAGTIRLVGQPQAQAQAQPQPQPIQGERKPLGPPTRPSAIRASQQVQAIRQSAAVASQYTYAQTQTSSVLAQSRLALQSQLEAEAAEIASEDIVLPDIASEYSDSGDETDTSPAFKRPAWAESPELRAALAAQARKNPDELFGPIRPLLMEELFKQHKGKFRSRTSSGNWTRDGLRKEEEEEYARRMGFTTGTGQW